MASGGGVNGVAELRYRIAAGQRGGAGRHRAALGQRAVEGHINRLKLIKRQMFGRAKFDLLRRRVLCAA
jgi:hypothetical protein